MPGQSDLTASGAALCVVLRGTQLFRESRLCSASSYALDTASVAKQDSPDLIIRFCDR